jgi:hypothetical protein
LVSAFGNESVALLACGFARIEPRGTTVYSQHRDPIPQAPIETRQNIIVAARLMDHHETTDS